MKKYLFSLLILCLLSGGVNTVCADMAPPVASPAPSEEASPSLGDSVTLLPHSFGKPAVGLKDLGAFSSLAVLHDGRVKPLETLSRHLLLQWSGQSSYHGQAALSVLAEILFAPEKTGDYKLFRIDNPEVATAMRIEAEKNRRYSYREIEPALHRLQMLAARADSIEEAKRNLVEKEVLRTMSNVVAYLNLTRAMQYAIPVPALTLRNPETRAALHLPEDSDAPTFWDLMERAPLLAHVLEGIGSRSAEQRSPMENEVVRLSRVMYLESQTGQSSLLRAFPDAAKPGIWYSPAEAISDPNQLQLSRESIGNLSAMTVAYRKGDAAEFAKHVEAFNHGTETLVPEQFKKTNFALEVLYERIDPLFLATLAYWTALFLCFFYFLWTRKWLYTVSWIAASCGIFLHIASIVSRILIMHRPPVTSLFETFPFVGAVAISVALFLERRSRQGVALLCASLLGVILLSIAARYAADGDTLQMLVAVLNSNFWLSTHVVCVTTGYAAVILCGAIGHIRLIRTVFPGQSTKESLREIDRMVFGTLCFGLLFAFIGTVLGGIWADQSWGRFWGWDPKENGALLIVLWCVILLHAKQWGTIREYGLAVGSVLGAVLVSLAWLGVNLLNVGLHSYGFTTGAAVKLFSYVGGELLFLILIFVGTAWRRKRNA